ncbi:MAG: alanine racemase [Pseudomonadota bacterium]
MNDTSGTPLFRPTRATVDLSALAHNCSVIKRRLSPKIKIMAMVKADAYGHGAVPVARTLERAGAHAFGVATVEEGIELREAGIKVPVIVIGGLMGAGSPASKKMVDAALTPVIHSAGVLDSLEVEAKRLGKKVGVHLKIDTGMSRLGVRPEALRPVLDGIGKCEHLFVEGVMTHLAEADRPDVSERQMELFLECRTAVEKALGPIKIWHVANSGAILRGEPVDVPEASQVWARPGLALYGDRNGSDFGKEELKPVMGLVSQAVLLKGIPAGMKVSYGGIYTTSRPTRIAIVPIGYADGYPWALSGKAEVLVHGRRVQVVGRVTMDMIMVDVTDLDGASVGDEVVLLGVQGEGSIGLHEIAAWAGTITYEILCGISKRMPRIYTEWNTSST